MISNWFWATNPSDIVDSLFDFFSFGHISFGIVCFALFSLISTLRNLVDPNNFKIKNGDCITYPIESYR